MQQPDKARYEVRAAMMGWAVVMVTPEGDRRAVVVGIKRYDSAIKCATRWQLAEDNATRKATRDLTTPKEG